MLQPGTAFDTPSLGRDNQPTHMSGYVTTSRDDGGVHTNSGIPNRAFALAAVEVGDAGPIMGIWMTALRALGDPQAGFPKFADATIAAARTSPAGDLSGAMQRGWTAVGVTTTAPAPPAPVPAPAPAPTPAPAPMPVPQGAPFPDCDADVAARIAVAAQRSGLTQGAWLNRHLRGYFRLRRLLAVFGRS